ARRPERSTQRGHTRPGFVVCCALAVERGSRPRVPVTGVALMLPLPLWNIRILDLTMVWAGPYATRILGDLGAEVIKVEGVRNWDLLRDLHLLGQVEKAYDKSAYFNNLNRNKFGCTLDLAHPRGRDLCLKLAARCDVVMENYRPDVMRNLGLEYEAFRAVRKDIIMVSMPGHGKDGPEADRIAYGTNVEQLGGLVSVQGYEDRGPHKSGISYGDPMSGIAAAGAVISALFRRRATGEGSYIELAQREALTTLIGEKLLEYSMSVAAGRPEAIPQPTGNRHPAMAPHNVFRTAGGDDEWVAIACRNDADFEALCKVMGRPELLEDPRFADVVSRYRNQTELEAVISEWTQSRTAAEVCDLLGGAGVPVSAVATPAMLHEDPHLRSRGFFELVAHPNAGVWEIDALPYHYSLTPAHVRLPPPTFGQHNDYVFRGLLGLSETEVEALRAEGVIGEAPVREEVSG
ncbi:MAG TPA: CoA transferase, partial [Dehalococcoidia bacterium]|nr:CoA transferase [Dehalococcoidia bacterium]